MAAFGYLLKESGCESYVYIYIYDSIHNMIYIYMIYIYMIFDIWYLIYDIWFWYMIYMIYILYVSLSPDCEYSLGDVQCEKSKMFWWFRNNKSDVLRVFRCDVELGYTTNSLHTFEENPKFSRMGTWVTPQTFDFRHLARSDRSDQFYVSISLRPFFRNHFHTFLKTPFSNLWLPHGVDGI